MSPLATVLVASCALLGTSVGAYVANVRATLRYRRRWQEALAQLQDYVRVVDEADARAAEANERYWKAHR